MNHDNARKIFDEIRARPYEVSSAPGARAENCYYKGTELLQRLGTLGYAVRGCVGETYWDAQLFPKEIIALESPDFQVTHFWCEVLLNDTWCALDPSYDPALAKHGFAVCEFGDGKLCFDITRRYTIDEISPYKTMWSDPAYAERYYAANGPFLSALNDFFKKARAA